MNNPIVLTAMGLGIGALLILMSIGIAYLLIPRWVNSYLRDLAQAIPEPKPKAPITNLHLRDEDETFLDRVVRDL